MYLAERNKENMTKLICQLVSASVSLDVIDLHERINSSYGQRILQTPSTLNYTSTDERQRFARIALGTALPLTFYEPLQSSAQTDVEAEDVFSKNDDSPSLTKPLSFIYVRYRDWKQYDQANF